MYVYILVVTPSSSFPYLFWGIFSCWLRFELNQPPSKTHYLWQNCGRMWLSMFSPVLESPKKPGYESVSSELTGEELQLWVPRLTIWLPRFLLKHRCHDLQTVEMPVERTFLWASTTLLLVHWQSVLKLQDWRICDWSMGMKWNKTIRAGFCWTKPSRLKRFEMHWHLCFNAWPTFGKVFTVVQQKFGGLVTVLLLLQPSSLHELERQIDFTCFDG